jgi:D-alanyl-D-alanine carboxypeptidase
MQGMIVERLTVLTFGAALEQRILIHLSETSYPTTSALPEPFAHGDERTALHSETAHDRQSVDSETDFRPETIVIDATEIAPSIAGAAGAVVSTLGDLDRWIDVLTESRSISPSLHEERMRFGPIPGSDDRGGGWGYGFGVANFGGLIGHNGGIPGFQSFAAHMPGTGANIIVLANINTGPGGKVPADTIAVALSKLNGLQT